MAGTPPLVDLEARHTRHARLLPNKIALAEALPKQARVAEIGVADGDFSAEILRHAAPRALHLIDSWQMTRYAAGKARVEARFAAEIAAGQVRVHQGLSLDVLSGFDSASLDWVYIDTDHSYDLTSKELALCATVVAEGGRICGDDFTAGNVVKPIRYGVIPAVNEFCVRHGWQYEYLTLDSDAHFSFCLMRL